MTSDRDTILRMAREADIDPHDMCEDPRIAENNLAHFAALVAAAEREACAQRLEAIGCDHCASNIRARGQPTRADALNAWAADRLARYGIPTPDDDKGPLCF